MMKKLNRFRFIPFILIAVSLLLILILLTQTNQLYAWVPQGYCYGTGCYSGGKRPGNFYQAAFAYGDTLVGFIFLWINLLLLLAAFIVGIFHIVKKEIKTGLLIFDIIFGGIYFTFGLVMSIFMAVCCYIDDGLGIPICGFLSTFNILLLIGAAIAFLILTGIAKKRDAMALEGGGGASVESEALPSGEESSSSEEKPLEEKKEEEKPEDGKPGEGKKKLSKTFGLIFPLVGLGALLILFFASSITRIVDFFEFLTRNIENNYWDNYLALISTGLFMLVTLATTIVILIFFIGHFANRFDGHKTIKKLPILSLVSAAGLYLVMLLETIYWFTIQTEYRPDTSSQITLMVFSILTIGASIAALVMKKPLLNKIFIAISQGLSIIILEILGFTSLIRFAVPYELATFFLLAMTVANFFILPREE